MEATPIDIDEPLLTRWRNTARQNKRLHEAARSYHKTLSDNSLVSAVSLGVVGGILNICLGIVDNRYQSVINIGQVVLGSTSLVSAGIISISNQLGWPQKHQLHEEYSARYGELCRMINSEEILVRMHDSTYASRGDFIRTVKSELDRIEDHAPPIPASVEKRSQ